MQVTSVIPDAQQFTINFANNNLLGSAQLHAHLQDQQSPRLRHRGDDDHRLRLPGHPQPGPVAPHLLPTDFIQIKGRGTRKHNFLENSLTTASKGSWSQPQKTTFKLFDFFANCEYFEEKFDYDEVLKLPAVRQQGRAETTGHRSVYDGTTSTWAPTSWPRIKEAGHRLRGHEDRPHVL